MEAYSRLTHILGVLSWSLPIIALTILAYAIEYYTKFKTYWKLLLLASLMSLSNSLFTSYKYWTLGDIPVTQMLAADLLLLSGTMLAGYASIKLLKFQNLQIGKTSTTIRVLSVAAIIIPVISYLLDGFSLASLLDTMAYNLSIIFLMLVFLTFGKISRQYVSTHKQLAYTSARLGSILLLADPIQRNYAVFSGVEVTSKQIFGSLAVFTHFFADLLLVPPLILLLMEAKARGLHLIPGGEEEKSSEPIKYRLRKGFSYLVRERENQESVHLLKDYVTHGYFGLAITRTQPSVIREDYGLHTTPILWMTKTQTDEKTVKPNDLKRLESIIKDFIRNKGDFILIQRLDYLVTQNDFDSVLSMLQDVSDVVKTSNSILVIALDTSTLTRQQQSLLIQELETLDMSEQTVLNESLFELIKFIYGENKRRRMPNIKAVTRNFDITKTTARKRVYELEAMGLVNMVKEGRSKLLELTPDGKKIIKAPVGPVER